jgi:hypothetical protein
MSIIQIIAFIVLIALIGFVIFGLLLQFHIRQFQDGNDKEHVKKLREWIKRNPKRAEELGYTRKERIEDV